MCRWLAVERILKGAVGIFAVVLGDLNLSASGPSLSTQDGGVLPVQIGQILFVSISLVIVCVHLLLMHIWHPTCSVTFVTRARVILLYIAGFGQLVTLAMLLSPWDGWLRSLLTCWSLALAGLVVYALYKIFCSPLPENESEEVTRQRIRAAQNNLLKHGVAGKKKGVISKARGSIQTGRNRVTSIIAVAVTPKSQNDQFVSILRPPPPPPPPPA